MNRRSESGFSLVEILLVLGVIAVLAIAAFIILPKVQSKNRANAEAQRLSVLVANIDRVFNGKKLQDMNLLVMSQAKMVPSGWEHDNNSSMYSNAWNQELFACGSSSAYTIYYVIPNDGCSDMVAASSYLFNNISINGTDIKTSSSPIDIGQAVQECAQDGRIELRLTRGDYEVSCN